MILPSAVTFSKHEAQQSHLASMVKFKEFLAQCNAQRPDVTRQLQTVHAQQVKENQAKLLGILKCIEFCGRQNIPFRGHRNESWDPSSNDRPHTNPGNFLALVHFRHDAGDSSVARAFHSAGSRKITYLNHHVQNELITASGNYIREQILAQARAAPFFAISADEASDVSNQEQLPLVLRFVDKGQVVEEFIDFLLCSEGTSGQALATLVLDQLKVYGLSIEKLRGQAYDGAGAMAGKVNGMAAIIQREQPKALFMHCASHCLNLAVVAITSVAAVRNMWSTMLETCLFFKGMSHPLPPPPSYSLPQSALLRSNIGLILSGNHVF